LPQGITIPLIREGKIYLDAFSNLNYSVNNLLRIANPSEILRLPAEDTINYGFLQSTNTQKSFIPNACV